MFLQNEKILFRIFYVAFFSSSVNVVGLFATLLVGNVCGIELVSAKAERLSILGVWACSIYGGTIFAISRIHSRALPTMFVIYVSISVFLSIVCPLFLQAIQR